MDYGPRVEDAGPDSLQLAIRAARWLGLDLDQDRQASLTVYRDWLEREAIPGGGVGPNETNRLWSRHIADSLLFGLALEDVKECGDLGSGAGLPGIPLAIIRPEVEFSLVDKSRRRCDLLDRAIVVLGLRNCTIIHSDLGAVDRKWKSIVSRAAMPIEHLVIHVKRCLETGGSGIVGLTRTRPGRFKTPAPPPGLSFEVVDVPDDILDTRVQLLRIEAF